jgi:murein DD-endopeptidase MepM/ murein hydrolase activator NlpD
MPRSNVQSRLRASSPLWPRVAVLALVGMSAAGCSDSARFDSNSYAANNRQAPPQEVTGSVAPRPAYSNRVESQPLPPAPGQVQSQPASATAQGSYAQGGYSNGAQGLGAYRPGTQNYSDATGSVSTPRAAPPPKPAGAWTWDGGAPVTVGYGDTVETIARKHNVPVSAILETNGITNAGAIKPGQRLVIPRYVTNTASQPAAHAPAQASMRPSTDEAIHVVQPGESLGGIAQRHGVSLIALAKANRIQPYAKVSMGDRLKIPGGHPVASRQPQNQSPAPQVAQPRTVAPDKYAAATPPQNARMATQEPAATDTPANAAEPAGSVPSFRWPARGRVIAGFGPKSGGGQNDGINLAVPEGTPIKAADDGVVAYAGNELKGYGNLVLIRHANGFVSAYAHASELLVKRGDTIKRGQVIANAGQTGNVTSPQLHFEIRKGSTPVDPAKYLSGA